MSQLQTQFTESWDFLSLNIGQLGGVKERKAGLEAQSLAWCPPIKTNTCMEHLQKTGPLCDPDGETKPSTLQTCLDAHNT